MAVVFRLFLCVLLLHQRAIKVLEMEKKSMSAVAFCRLNGKFGCEMPLDRREDERKVFIAYIKTVYYEKQNYSELPFLHSSCE